MVTGVDVRVAGSFDSNLLVLGRVGFLDHLYHIERVCDYCFILFLCFALRNFSFVHWFQWHLWALGFLWFTNSKVGMNLQLFSSAFVLNAAWCPYHASLQNYQCTTWDHQCNQSWAVIHLLPPSIALHPACQKTPTCICRAGVCPVAPFAKFKIPNLSYWTRMLHIHEVLNLDEIKN